MSVTIDKKQTLALLHDQVEAKGADYVYPGAVSGNCLYIDGNEPSCIVGYVFVAAGVPMGDINEYVSPDYALEYSSGVRFTQQAYDLLAKVQSWQDSGLPWGEAVEKAKAGLTPQYTNGVAQ